MLLVMFQTQEEQLDNLIIDIRNIRLLLSITDGHLTLYKNKSQENLKHKC